MEKIVIITRETRLDSLISKFNTKEQAKFYIEHLGANFSEYEIEHNDYYLNLELLLKQCSKFGIIQKINWKHLPNYLFGKNDLIITFGQDGLVANSLKYLSTQKVIGINSDTNRWDGILSQFNIEDINNIIPNSLSNKVNLKHITKAKVKLNDQQELLAINDFFIGVKTHSSARYEISHNKNKEFQSSSGVIVSTPLGYSGWMKSVLAGATSVVNSIKKEKIKIQQKKTANWDSNSLTFAVREPFPSISTSTNITFGKIKEKDTFVIESKMGEDGIIFSDGVQNDFLDFNYSIKAKFSIADEKGILVTKF